MLVFLLGSVLLLALGLISYHRIPVFDRFWMLDFHNVFQFQHCVADTGRSPYLLTGAECGDVTQRSFIYPPLLFTLFHWLRWIDSFGIATRLWAAGMVAIIIAVGAGWIWSATRRPHFRRERLVLSGVWVFLLIQVPFVFALERGSNDVVPLAMWTAAALLFVIDRPLLSGIFAGLAVVAKAYPAFGLLALAPALLTLGRRGWRFIAGVAVGAIVPSVVLWNETWLWLTEKSAELTSRYLASPLTPYSHSLHALPGPDLVSILVGAALLAAWIYAALMALRIQPGMVFAGSLAISTFYSRIAWDYNLITVYPLLVLVFWRALRDRSATWAGLWAGLVLVLMAGREVFRVQALAYLQPLALAVVGWAVGWSARREARSAGDPASHAQERNSPDLP